MTTPYDKSTMRKIVDYWPLILSLVAMVIAWTTLSNKTQAQDLRITSVESRLSDDEAKGDQFNTKVLTQLSQIQTDLSWLKNRLK